MTAETSPPPGSRTTPGGPHSGEKSSLFVRHRLRPRTKEKVVRLDDSSLPVSTKDDWLDNVTDTAADTKTKVRWRDRFSAPYQWLRKLWRFATTTPGKMITMTLILAAALFAAGYSMSQSSAQRQADLIDLLDTAEPTSYAAHNLYTTLSLADTIASSSMVVAGTEDESSYNSYFSALDRAAAAASDVSAGLAADDDTSARLIASIQRQIPIYAGLVETARTNNRQANPVAVSYMTEASSLMRNRILVDAATLFDRTSAAVNDRQAQVGRPQLVPLSGLLAAVLFLVLSQWWLWRITRRRLNKGFLTATAMMVLAIVWVLTSNAVTWNSAVRGFAQAATPWDSLTASRIYAQQTRTAETLALVHRESISDANDSFQETVAGISQALDDVAAVSAVNAASAAGAPSSSDAQLIDQARAALRSWQSAHGRLVFALNNGDFEAAAQQTTAQTTAGGDATAAAAFAEVDTDLSKLIANSRETMRAYISDGLAATRSVSLAVFLLSIASVIAVVLGIRPRFQEYL